MTAGAGGMRSRLRFEMRPKQADDGNGNTEGAWEEQFCSAAKVEPLKGSETVIAARLAGVQPVIITIWSHCRARQVTNAWRCVDTRTGAVYNIQAAVNPDQNNRLIELLAQTGVPT
jgi:SPP1 family predicted phage head-tail adaptor